jgi:hypothetical protein
MFPRAADSFFAGEDAVDSNALDSEVGNSFAVLVGTSTVAPLTGTDPVAAAASTAFACSYWRLHGPVAVTVSPVDGGLIVGAVSASCVLATGVFAI